MMVRSKEDEEEVEGMTSFLGADNLKYKSI